MSDPMQEIRASFFVECEELLEALMDALQEMSDGDVSSEIINVAFRAVHSIKGGAGAFGLDDLVAFAHQFETVMDQCRAGQTEVEPTICDLFLRCGDVLSDLVRVARDETDLDPTIVPPILAELATFTIGGGSEEEEAAPIDFAPATIALDDLGGGDETPDVDLDALLSEPPDFPEAGPDDDAPIVASDDPVPTAGPSDKLTINFRPDPELYGTGNEPVYLLRALADLGPCETTLAFDPPNSIDQIEPLGGRLSWTIQLPATVDVSAVQEIFEFAEGLCKLSIQEGTASPQAAPIDEAPVVEEVQSPTPPPAPEPVVAEETPAPTERPTKAEPEARGGGDDKKGGGKPSATVRVDIDRIDRLVNLVGELVINQAMIAQSISDEALKSNTSLSTGLEEFQQLTRDIQESVMMIRAQPVKSLFQRMSRIVRESSAAVNKRVKLVTEGESTEIDKTAIERLAEPLTHMVRNAVDHGLESTEGRIAAGKSEAGEIRLSASHKSGRVLIEISDDGSGINRDKVLSIAKNKGLIPEDAQLTEGEIDQLLFLPGFSTAKEVSKLSGRGVGMDVVRTQITALGGRVTISTSQGKGTTFSISLPLTLAVLDGMVVSVGGEAMVMPLNAIVETLSIGPDDVRQVEPGKDVIHVRGNFAPVIDLADKLGYADDSNGLEGKIALLVAPEEGLPVAMIVEAIEDQRQVVIKGLQDSYGHIPGVAAATILGDGKIALILDPSDLARGEQRHGEVVNFERKVS